MDLSKEDRQKIAAAEAITDAIAKRKESKKDAKDGVDLVALTEKLAERKLAEDKE